MSRHRSRVLALVILLCAMPVAGESMRATLGLEYDSNPFEGTASRRPGWVSRLYLCTGSRLMDRATAAVEMHHRAGVKRFWRRDAAATEAGDVVANHMELRGTWRPTRPLAVDWGADVKLKNVQRVSSDESYLRGGAELGLTREWRRGISTTIELRRAGDDARDSALVDLARSKLGVKIRWRQSRRLVAEAGVRHHWLAYDRPVFVLGPAGKRLSTGPDTQKDRLREWHLGLQAYTRLLVQVGYTYLDNTSNSAGYAYRAHRLRMTLARHLGYGVDGHLFVAAQRRDYTDDLTSVAPRDANAQNEYEQTLISVRLARQLSNRYGLSWRYRWARSGNARSGQFYRKGVYSISIDMVL